MPASIELAVVWRHNMPPPLQVLRIYSTGAGAPTEQYFRIHLPGGTCSGMFAI